MDALARVAGYWLLCFFGALLCLLGVATLVRAVMAAHLKRWRQDEALPGKCARLPHKAMPRIAYREHSFASYDTIEHLIGETVQ